MSAAVTRLVQSARYFGPGVVTEVDGRVVTVSLKGGGVVDAELAIAYEPVLGDTLLVAGDGDHYVIGVLTGRGKHVFSAEGDVVIHAVGGALELRGDAGLRITAPAVDVRAGTLRTVARTVRHARPSDDFCVLEVAASWPGSASMRFR